MVSLRYYLELTYVYLQVDYVHHFDREMLPSRKNDNSSDKVSSLFILERFVTWA